MYEDLLYIAIFKASTLIHFMQINTMKMTNTLPIQMLTKGTNYMYKNTICTSILHIAADILKICLHLCYTESLEMS